jgi:hypothetical protein
MPTFTVHEPPPRKGEAAAAPERFVFVRDGFYVWAFLLTPLWLLVHRLWLAFVVYLVVCGLIGAGLVAAGATPPLQFLAALLIALLMGFEAATIRRRKLTRRGWKTVGFVIGEDAEMAERRFFAAWAERAAETPEVPAAASTSAPPKPVYTAPMRRGPPSGNDVIGLFPEPGT